MGKMADEPEGYRDQMRAFVETVAPSAIVRSAPSCAPGEVERAFRAGWITRGDYGVDRSDYAELIDAELRSYLAALSPQGLDAKEGAISPDASTHSPRPRG